MTVRTKATKTKKRKVRREKIEISSGNVFADLGFEDAEQLLLKAELTSRIAQLIEKRAGRRLKLPSEQVWINQRSRDFCAASYLVFLPIDFSRS